jgi:hypothetical protein
LLALGAYGALLFASAPAWPDDWDGVGFVESIQDFDLGRFHPHPPGYPVYVALLRIAAVIAGDPMRACVGVAAASGAVAIAFTWDAVRRSAGERTAWMAAVAVAVAPAVWRICSGVGSEAPALACAAACGWGIAVSSRPGPSRSWAGAIALGVGAGIGVGVRLSWAPLYAAALGMAPRAGRARASGAAAVACAAWATPFVARVGAAKLAGLYTEHFAGHAARWGGTIVTEPGTVRLLWIARDVFVDGLGAGSDGVGVAIGALVAVAAWQAMLRWRAGRWRSWRAVAGAVVPYLLWIGLGQNLRDQPRHAVPLVALLAAGLAVAAGESRRACAVAGALAMATSLRAAADAHARRTIPPPGEQLVELARAQPSPERLAVFGAASVRFFETTELAPRARVVGSLGEAHLELTRFAVLPARVWVTSEVAGLDDPTTRLSLIANLCRPARIDRAMPCLRIFEMDSRRLHVKAPCPR